MRVFNSGLQAALLLAGLLPQGAQAQFRPPPVSPYLNLARRDINPAINYYGLVRPQFELRNTLQQFGNQITGLEQQQAALGNEFTADLPQTGVRAGFQTQN